MWKFSLGKAVKNDSLINNCAIFIVIFAVLLVLNLGFGIVITKGEIILERNYALAAFKGIFIAIGLVLIIAKAFYISTFLSSGEELEAETITYFDGKKYTLRIIYDYNGQHFDRDFKVEDTAELKKITAAGKTKILINRRNPKKVLLAELLADND